MAPLAGPAPAKILRKVLFIETTHTRVGGVGSRHARLAEAIPQLGWTAVFALTRGARFHDPARYLENLPTLDSVVMDGRSGSSEGRRIAVASAIRKVRPDVVIPGAVLDGWVVAAALKEREFFRTVYGLPGIVLNTVAFVREHADMLDAAYGVSPLTASVLRDYCGVPADRLFVVPTGVAPALRVSKSTIDESIRLLYVGRFDPDKGILDAIRLLDELKRRGVRFHFTFVGSGIHARDLELAAIRHEGSVDVVPPMSPRELYESVYPEADAILLFSPVEGLPNVLLEAMAHGVVPITSDFIGRVECNLFFDRETALIFPVGNAVAASHLVESLARDPEMKSRIGAKARQLIEKDRGVVRMAASFVDVLDRAMAGESRADSGAMPPLEGRSRLRRWFGPRLAEAIRRAVGRSFAHPDASEWPLIDNVVPHDREGEERRLRKVVEGARA